MKKIISLCFATFLVCSMSFAQETSSTSEETTVKSCIPIEECAAKMGMTVAAYKEYCKKKCGDKEGSKASATSSATAIFASLTPKGEGAEKAQSCNIAECAAILGISLEECMARIKAGCGGMAKAENTSGAQLASALMVSNKAPTKSAKANCVKSAKACQSKKIN